MTAEEYFGSWHHSCLDDSGAFNFAAFTAHCSPPKWLFDAFDGLSYTRLALTLLGPRSEL